MADPMQNIIKSAAKSIKNAFKNADWWKFVQDEVKNELFTIIDNVDVLGISFRDAFIAQFAYEHRVRMMNKDAFHHNVPGAVFGRGLSEECYHSGIGPTHALLRLDDWLQPNDADVQACVHLCQQIDVLEILKVLKKPAEKGIYANIKGRITSKKLSNILPPDIFGDTDKIGD